MILPIVISVAVLIVVFVVVVALRPSAFRITRSAAIGAPPGVVFDHVNGFRAWGAWSPWEHIDPNLQRSYAGPEAGVGAKYAWVGNSQVGAGNMTIERCERPSLIVIRLEFIKPFAGVNTATFAFKPSGAGTEVSWTMEGHYIFITKAIGLFVNMDKMIGKNFEDGLAKLKSISEAEARPTPVNV